MAEQIERPADVVGALRDVAGHDQPILRIGRVQRLGHRLVAGVTGVTVADRPEGGATTGQPTGAGADCPTLSWAWRHPGALTAPHPGFCGFPGDHRPSGAPRLVGADARRRDSARDHYIPDTDRPPAPSWCADPMAGPSLFSIIYARVYAARGLSRGVPERARHLQIRR